MISSPYMLNCHYFLTMDNGNFVVCQSNFYSAIESCAQIVDQMSRQALFFGELKFMRKAVTPWKIVVVIFHILIP